MGLDKVIFAVVICSTSLGIFACAWFVGYIISTYVFGDNFGPWNVWCVIFGNIAICPIWMIYIICAFMWKKMIQRNLTSVYEPC